MLVATKSSERLKGLRFSNRPPILSLQNRALDRFGFCSPIQESAVLKVENSLPSRYTELGQTQGVCGAVALVGLYLRQNGGCNVC